MRAENTDAQTEVLRRVRGALGGRGADSAEAVRAEWDAIPRLYRRQSGLEHEAVVECLVERLRDYDAQVERVGTSGLRRAIERHIAARGITRILIAQGLRMVLLEQFGQALPGGFEFVEDDESLSYSTLNEIAAVITTAQVAIAATGTLVLQAVPGQGRRAATLIPDYHLCVMHERDIVETVPEAMDLLSETSRLATTFVSGPSATADIEMTRIKGVHGPRFLDVLLVS
jgi:L-lactate dehydrogenase complex protein LldG